MFNSILDFNKAKTRGDSISMITCYDYSSAKLLAESTIDCVLVGDSVAMVMHGYDSTIHADIAMMEAHISAVRRGLGPHGFIIGDLPFLEHRKGVANAVEASGRLMRAGANAVKIEGLEGHSDVIEAITGSGIPVMGHLGLTPQSVHAFGGYKVQGKEEESQRKMLEAAVELQRLGCFSVVLECVPSSLAEKISDELAISVIGIGAGEKVDGQVLVWQDVLGLNMDFKPKFVRVFADIGIGIKEALDAYNSSVKNKSFPSRQEEFH